MKHGTDWYKRDPLAFLGGVQGMSAKEIAVFTVVLDLIYQHGGSINDDPKWIAGWFSDMGAASVRKVIQALVERGKLQREGDQLTQKRAKNEAKTRENLSETRAKTGRKGGVLSGESRSETKENNNLSEAKNAQREGEGEGEKITPLAPQGGRRRGQPQFGLSENVKRMLLEGNQK